MGHPSHAGTKDAPLEETNLSNSNWEMAESIEFVSLGIPYRKRPNIDVLLIASI